MTSSTVQTLEEIELFHKERMLEFNRQLLTEELFPAAFKEDLETFRRCVEDGADVNGKSFLGKPIIVEAASAGVEFLKCLIEKGADVNVNSYALETNALNNACAKDGESVELLLMNGARARSTEFSACVQRAATANNLKGLKALLYFAWHRQVYNRMPKRGFFMPVGSKCCNLLIECGFTPSVSSRSKMYLEYNKKIDEEKRELQQSTFDSITKEVSVSLFKCVRDKIIDICIVMYSLLQAPYIILEIIDWFPNYDMVQHRCKIDLIFKCFASMRKIYSKK